MNASDTLNVVILAYRFKQNKQRYSVVYCMTFLGFPEIPFFATLHAIENIFVRYYTIWLQSSYINMYVHRCYVQIIMRALK